MEVYFSHSYRDVTINSYFLDQLTRKNVQVWADKKTDIWCVAKLERYMLELPGFVSIIPRRVSEGGDIGYSPFIGQELTLARRSRIPRLLFVDERVFGRYREDFPDDAVPFIADEPGLESSRHEQALLNFTKKLASARRPAREFRPRHAVLVVPDHKVIGRAAADVVAILKGVGYTVGVLRGPELQQAFDRVRLLEEVVTAEVCVFMLGERLSHAHVVLAMAHAHFVPTIRLQYQAASSETQVSVGGVIGWSASDQMCAEFTRQFESFRRGLITPLEIQRSGSPTEAVESLGVMDWQAAEEEIWDPADGPGLLRHVATSDAFVEDQVNRISREVGKRPGLDRSRPTSQDICRRLYARVKGLGFSYGFESPPFSEHRQKIRPPKKIVDHKTATCIDLACLFGSLLECAHQRPLVIVLDKPGAAHALVGYLALDEPSWEKGKQLGDLRGSNTVGDILLFEPTGAVASDRVVGAETLAQRQDKFIDFDDAKEAATRMLAQADVKVRHILDIEAIRTSGGGAGSLA
jgi:hypothetical protein